MKISIVTATYNSSKTLERCINSVFSQKNVNKEHIIIDGFSSDGTLDIIRKNEDKIDLWISEKDNGIYDAINKGISLAKGDIVALLHSDDYYKDEFVLSKFVHYMKEYNLDVLFSDLIYIRDSDNANTSTKVLRYWRAYRGKNGLIVNYKKLIKFGWMPPHPTLIIRRELFEKIGYYNVNYKIAGDYDFILRLFSMDNLRIFYLPEVTYVMSIGGTSNNGLKNILKKSYEDYKILKNHRIKIPILVLFCKNFSKINQFFNNQDNLKKI